MDEGIGQYFRISEHQAAISARTRPPFQLRISYELIMGIEAPQGALMDAQVDAV
jgi:hypothetical protein